LVALEVYGDKGAERAKDGDPEGPWVRLYEGLPGFGVKSGGDQGGSQKLNEEDAKTIASAFILLKDDRLLTNRSFE
jgi:hypothetical protein